MSHEFLFQFSSGITLTVWLLYVFVPRWKWTGRYAISIIGVLLALIYTYLISQSLTVSDMSNFSSLAGIEELFRNGDAILAGWIHYLAFDMLAGWFILKNSQKHQINHYLIILCLIFTFMTGPLGFLLYLIIRTVKLRKYFAEN